MVIFKYFSMFSGIGGFEYGIGNQGECIGFSEIDKYAKSIYECHFPDHHNWGDARGIKTEELPEFHLLVAGFPCQAFSVAGKRGGFKDTRGTLFFEIGRVLKDKRPRYFLLENVAGLLYHAGGETFQTILRVLTTMGYQCEWQVLNSKDFGVPQNRERVFIVGHLTGTGGGGGQVFPIGQSSGNSLKFVKGVMGEDNNMWLEDGKSFSRNFPQGQRVYSADGLSTTLSANAGDWGGKTGLYASCLDANYGKGIDNHNQRTVVSVPLRYLDRNQKNFPSEYSMCVDSSGTTGVMDNIGIRRLTPVECERLQGFPDGWTEKGIIDGEEVGISDTQRYKCLGNAVTTTVVSAIMRRFVDGNVC